MGLTVRMSAVPDLAYTARARPLHAHALFQEVWSLLRSIGLSVGLRAKCEGIFLSCRSCSTMQRLLGYCVAHERERKRPSRMMGDQLLEGSR